MIGPYCKMTRNAVTATYPMHWNPKAYLRGARGDWHGQWQVEIPDDDLTTEIINFNLCEGDTEGRIDDNGCMPPWFEWRIVGDMSFRHEAKP